MLTRLSGDGSNTDMSETQAWTDEHRRLAERTRDDWDGAAEAWSQWEPHIAAFLWPVTQRLIEAADIQPGHHVLDAGCGVGDPTLAVALRVGPGGRVLAIDPAQRMIDTAQRRARAMELDNVEFRAAWVDDLQPPPKPFDAVVGRFSFIFSPDVCAALRRLRGMMRPGARLAMSAWTPMENSPGFLVINEVLRKHVDMPAVDATQPGMHHLSGPGMLVAALSEAGFRDVRTSPVRIYQFARNGAEFRRMSFEMSASLKKVLMRLPEATRAVIGDEIGRRVEADERFRQDGVLRIPALAQVGSGCA